MQGVLLETMGDEKIDLHPSAKLSNSVNEEKYIRKQLSVRSQASGRHYVGKKVRDGESHSHGSGQGRLARSWSMNLVLKREETVLR